MSLHRFTKLTAAVSVAAAIALASGTAGAQQPRIPPDARGYQTFLIQQRAYQSVAPRPQPVPHPSPAFRTAQPTGATVRVDVPDAPPTYVTIRGPDGQVRRFPLAKGVKVEYRSQTVTLRPGESTTIRLTPLE